MQPNTGRNGILEVSQIATKCYFSVWSDACDVCQLWKCIYSDSFFYSK